MSDERDKARRRMIRHLRKGGVVVREDAGGAVGIYWSRADRAGLPFDQVIGDRLLETGCKLKGELYELVRLDFLASDSYCLHPRKGEAVA